MNLNTEDYLKKTLLDTQERIRDFVNYAEEIEEDALKHYFKAYAETEGKQARRLQGFLRDIQNRP